MKQTLTQRVPKPINMEYVGIPNEIKEYINALIYVVTELSERAVLQPTEEEALKQMKREMGYTAQASTGGYCCCKTPKHQDPNSTIYAAGFCYACSKECKPIKQEVKDCKLIVNKELREKIYEELFIYVTPNTAYKLADTIIKLLNK